MARPVSSKVSRIAASASARAKPGEGRRTRALSFSSTCAIERAGRGHAPVLRLDPAAGKDELARHEPVAGMPLAHQHPRGPRSERSTRMSVAASRGRSARAARGGVGHVLLPSAAPNPCMPSAHCWPTIAPLAARQDEETRDHRHREPEYGDPEQRRMRPDFIRHQDAGADRMGDDQERDIGRRVVCAVAAERLAADLAGVDDLEIGAEQAASAAGRTPAKKAARHRLAQRAVRRGRRNAPDAGHVVHRRLPL